jgi:hypothetical protein
MTKKHRTQKRPDGIYFRGIHDHINKPYPAWRYHDYFEPKIVNNTDEDCQASVAGWKKINVPLTGFSPIQNWAHDLQDMSSRQLCMFAKEEYGVDLPKQADAETLLKAIWRLARAAPQSKDRIILLAQTIKMNWDETMEELRKIEKRFQAVEAGGHDDEIEIIKGEFTA